MFPTHTAHSHVDSDRRPVSDVSRPCLAAGWKVLANSTMVVLLAAAPASLNAQAIVTELQAMKTVTETTADGRQIETLVPVATIVPGEQVIYTLNYGNESDTPLTGIVVSLPVPEDMTLVPGSADQTGTTVTYSIDGGTTYDQLERLVITTEDGLERPARADDVTSIRWTIADALEPAQSGTVRCIAAVD